MRARSFKIFGTKTDLENIFKDFQTYYFTYNNIHNLV